MRKAFRPRLIPYNMGIIKKPSELEVKSTLTALIYGSPGVGKSTIACSAPAAVMLDFDNGVNRVNGAHRIPTAQVRNWEEVVEVLEEIKAEPSYRTIIIDTVGKMMAYMEDFIKRTNPKMKQYDGSLSLKGFGMRKQMFINFIKEVGMTGKNIIFVAHELEQKRGDETILRPEIGGSSGNDLIKELDLVGYMEMYGNKRTISFSPCEKYYAKNTCGLPGVIEIPVTVDEHDNPIGENTFMQTVIKAYRDRLVRSKEQTAEYEALNDTIAEKIGDITSAADANAFVIWMADVKHVYNSRAVAAAKFQTKVKELGLSFDKETKTYNDPATESNGAA